MDIFTKPSLKGKLDINTIGTSNKNLYDHLLFDSNSEKDFDKDKFYNCILENLDKRSYKQESLEKMFNVTDYKAYIDFINQDFSDKEFSSDIHLMQQLFKTLYERYTEYIHHRIELLVNNKSLKNLSAGQKGTIYLRLQLATNLFSETIIYDQPEDDLDNKFINESLVELFKKIKKYRPLPVDVRDRSRIIQKGKKI